IAIVDFDVHHGNGTQDAFNGDGSVLYASLHQVGIYPGTGGRGEGDATTVNVPLRPGCGDGEWVHALERYVEPAVSRFAPELVLVSAGFDAHEDEDIYLVDMHVTEDGFRELASRCAALAPRVAAVLDEEKQNLELPRRQHGGDRIGHTGTAAAPCTHLLEQPSGHRARQRRLPVRDPTEEADDALRRLALQEVAGRAAADRPEQ